MCFGSLGIFACAIACGGSDGSADMSSSGAAANAGSSSAGSGSAGGPAASGGHTSTSGGSVSVGGSSVNSAGNSGGGATSVAGATSSAGADAGGLGGAAQAGAAGVGGAQGGSGGAQQGGAAGSGTGLDPTKVPGKNFDLSHFQLQLPIADGDSVKQISASALATYTSEYFYTDTDGAMTFWCPVTGAHTPNTHYPRTELRETAVGGDWQITGKHSLIAKFKVTKSPSSKGTIIGQIHGNATDGTAEVLKLEWLSTNQIVASVEDNNDPATQVNKTIGSYTLGSEYTYSIQLENSNLTVTITDGQGGSKSVTSPYTAASWKNDSYYFKLGDYVQLNTGADTDGGRVSFYSFTITHG